MNLLLDRNDCLIREFLVFEYCHNTLEPKVVTGVK
jgi:hypothetical protein